MKKNRIIFVTLVGAVVNIILAAVKLLFGIVAHSQALIADGIHSLTDLVTDFAIIMGAKYWSAPADNCHPYGHGRIETLVNLFIGIILAFVGIGIGWNSIISIGQPNDYSPGWSALYVALVSIVVKEILYRWSAYEGHRILSRALVANAWHHRSDCLSSIPVAIGILGSKLFPEFTYLDNIAALLVTAMLLKATWKITWPTIKELIEARAEHEIEEKIFEYMKEFTDIREVHKIRTRRQGTSVLIDFHMLVEADMPILQAHDTASKLKRLIMKKEPEVLDVLIHIEPYLHQKLS
jgi:cation diffusion facilitator family transporter